MTWFKVLIVFYVTMSFGHSYSQENNLKLLLSDSIKFENLSKSKKVKNCNLPVSLTFSNVSKIDKIININKSKEFEINNHNGTIIINYLLPPNPKSLQFYSPYEFEKYYSDEFENVTQIKYKSKSSFGLTGKNAILNWDEKFKFYVSELKNYTSNRTLLYEGFELLKKYKENKEAAECLFSGFIEEAQVEKDSLGNNIYLFELEKLKKNPNLIFIGEENEGFRVYSKFNKYGFINIDNSSLNIELMYDSCGSFEFGHAICQLNKKLVIIDKKNKVCAAVNMGKRTSIKIISNSLFIVHSEKIKKANSKPLRDEFYYGSYLIDHKGKKISQHYKRIKAFHYTDKYFEVDTIIDFETGITNHKKGDYIISEKGELILSRMQEWGALYNICKMDSSSGARLYTNSCTPIPGTNQAFIHMSILPIIYDFDSDSLIYCLINLPKNVNEAKLTSIYNNNLKQFSQSGLWPVDFSQFKKNTFYPLQIFSDSIVISDMSLTTPYTYYIFDVKNDKLILNSSNGKNLFIPEFKSFIHGNWVYVRPELSPLINYQNLEFRIGLGVTNHNGVNIIPNIFKTIQPNINNSTLLLKDYFDREYEVLNNGDCISNCDSYYKVSKFYFKTY